MEKLNVKAHGHHVVAFKQRSYSMICLSKEELILSYFMLFGNLSLTHPSYIVADNIIDTVSRIQRIHDLVMITLPVIHQYQYIWYDKWKYQSMVRSISINQ